MRKLVPKFTIIKGKSVVINWKDLSVKMNRRAVDCKGRWMRVVEEDMKHGALTAAEDEIIRQRVKEWGNKGQGLWVAMSRELNRPKNTLSNRWIRVLKNC